MSHTEPIDPAIERDLRALEDALNGRPVADEFADITTIVAAVRADAVPVSARLAGRLERIVRRRGRRGIPRPWALAGAGATGLAAVVAVAMVATGGVGGHTQTTLLGKPLVGAAAGPARGSAPTPSLPAPQAAGPATPAATQRQVAHTATLGLTTSHGNVQAVADRVIAVTDSLGGIVQSSNVTTGDPGGDQAQLELQIPSAHLQEALGGLSRLAHVSSRTEQANDVTDNVSAARDHLAAARAARLALLRQLGSATTPNQVASIRAQLRLVADQIAQDARTLASLLRQTGYSGVSVSVSEGQPTSGAGGGSTLGGAASDAVNVLEASLAIALVGLAALVPALVVGAAGWRTTAIVRRRQRSHALDAQL